MAVPYCEHVLQVFDVPEDAMGVEEHEMPAPWLDQMEADIELGLEAVLANLREKYSQYGATFKIRDEEF